MLILGLLGFGLLVGWLAQLAVGDRRYPTNWAVALGAGLVGSFVGGLLLSLLAGDGLSLRPSGLIGSFIGAAVVTVVWQRIVVPMRHRRDT
jgi:uncharacterized membrane protein YeaQ/YmgE (transglycosylase-associated protein family)